MILDSEMISSHRSKSVRKPGEKGMRGREFIQDLVPCSVSLIIQSLKFETLDLVN